MAESMYVPTQEESLAGLRAFREREHRGPVYFQARNIITTGCGHAECMADGIAKLLRCWQWSFYCGSFDPRPLRECVAEHMDKINDLRDRRIQSLRCQDGTAVSELFDRFAAATARPRDGARSGVSAAKAIHLVAPGFLPLWDSSIALQYGRLFYDFGSTYVEFCWQMKTLTAAVSSYVENCGDRTVLKQVDEFNYSAYTKGWIQVGGGAKIEVPEREGRP